MTPVRGARHRGRRRPRLRRFRRPLRVRLHVLPARHAGPLDRRSGRRRARVGLHRLRPQQTRHRGRRPARRTARSTRASAASRPPISCAMTARPATKTTPMLIDDQPTGHQLFPDIAVANGTLHAIWWDSRNDPSLLARRAPSATTRRATPSPSLDVYGATSTDVRRVLDRPGADERRPRAIPTTSSSATAPYRSPATTCGSRRAAAGPSATWTDWRNTVQGADPREATRGRGRRQRRRQAVPHLHRRGRVER